MSTKIEWVKNNDGTQGVTWNPIIGCSKCSPGCEHCYAERMAHRLRHMGVSGYTSAIELGGWTGQTVLVPERMEDPLHWRKPRRVFVCSMSDLFHESTKESDILNVFGTMADCQHHTFIVLTKRAERMCEVLSSPTIANDVWLRTERGLDESNPVWPLPNLWLGVTVCNQAEADEKLPLLLQIPAAVRWVSIEPCLSEIDLHLDCFESEDGKVPMQKPPHFWHHQNCSSYCDYGCGGIEVKGGIDWVVCGAETGPGKRAMSLDWARSLRNQCAYMSVPFFFKKDSNGSRLLDGRTWDEMPEVNHG